MITPECFPYTQVMSSLKGTKWSREYKLGMDSFVQGFIGLAGNSTARISTVAIVPCSSGTSRVDDSTALIVMFLVSASSHLNYDSN